MTVSTERTHSRGNPEPCSFTDSSQRHVPARGFKRLKERCASFWVGCWIEKRFVVRKAHLLSLSGDGIQAIADGPIGRNQQVWLRRNLTRSSDTAPALVLASSWLRGGRCALRLALDEACPAGFLEGLVEDLAASESP